MTITNGYCTLADVKHSNVLVIDSSDSVSDDLLESIIEAVSRQIDDDCRRRFYTDSDPETRYYTANWTDHIFVDDICSPSSDITLEADINGDGTYDITFTSSDFYLAPYNAEAKGVPYTKIEVAPNSTYDLPAKVKKGVKITAQFGWASVPVEIKNACILQCARVFKRFSTPLGSESMSTLGKQTLTIPSLDNDVQYLISRYKKVVFG